MNTALNAGLTQALWTIFKWFLLLILVVIVFGIVWGIFTYGRPRKKVRSNGLMDEILEDSIVLTHAIIDRILGRNSTRTGDWLDDQQLLAMLRRMKPTEFEEFTARMFDALGYKTELVGGSGDGGVDIEMTKDGRSYLVQCKKFITRKVTPHDVRDFYGAIGDRQIDGRGFFVTTNIFTLEAERFAEGKALELIDGNRLIQIVRESGIVPNVNKGGDVERCPLCGGTLVVRMNHVDKTRFLGCSNFPKCHFTKPM
jgi:restriction system protein